MINLHIQMICEDILEAHIVMQNSKHVWISDDIWKSKLESCKLDQSNCEIQCKRHTGLIGIVRGHT